MLSTGTNGGFAAALCTFIWSVTLLTPVVALATFKACNSTSELGTSPLKVTTPLFTATFTLAARVASEAYNLA
jgi:hypothetical protein